MSVTFKKESLSKEGIVNTTLPAHLVIKLQHLKYDICNYLKTDVCQYL